MLNRIIVIIGFALGSLLAVGLIVVGAVLLGPRGIEPEHPGMAALGPAAVYGRIGLLVALLGMFFAFAGAAIENALSAAYNLAQFCGWPWGKFRAPRDAPKFHVAWIVVLLVATGIILTGVDPVSVVEYSIVFSVVILPLTYLPMLVVARDPVTMGRHTNGWLAESLGWGYFVINVVAAAAAIPLLVLTHGGKG
jgi:Mn2+/Fe2+ NRAMP family transporter